MHYMMEAVIIGAMAGYVVRAALMLLFRTPECTYAALTTVFVPNQCLLP